MADALNTIATQFDLARPWIGGLLCLIGAVLCVVGTVGVLRFPDFYTRLHAASVTDTSGALTLLAGMAFLSDHAVFADHEPDSLARGRECRAHSGA